MTNIDCVVTYLDPTDPFWQSEYRRINNVNPPLDNHNFDNQTSLFKYTLRGIAKHLKFINQLHLIVFSESQIPKWLNTKTVNIITHSQFVPKKFLPTFNSSTYKIYLGNLPNVSNNFILMSDDFYLLNDIDKQQFFTENMEPITERVRIAKDTLNLDIGSREWFKMEKRCNDLAKSILNISNDSTIYGWNHFPHAFNKSFCQKIFQQNKDLLEKTNTNIRDNSKNIEMLFWVVLTYLNYRHMDNEDIYTKLNEQSHNKYNYAYPNLSEITEQGKKCINLNYIDPNDIQKIEKQFSNLFQEKCIYEV